MSGFDSRGDREGTCYLLRAENSGNSSSAENLADRLAQLQGLAGSYQSWAQFSLPSECCSGCPAPAETLGSF